MKLVDFSFARPGGAAIKAAGFGGMMRYVPYAGDGGKGLTTAEVADYHENGLGIGLVFESTAGRMFDGCLAGEYDAHIANYGALSVGFPDTRPIYFACDTDVTPEQLTYVKDYMRGVASVFPLNRIGVYGEYDVIEFCHANGLAAWFWQSLAWSGGRLHPYRHIYQSLNGQFVNGGEVDFNEAYGEDQGLWKPEGASDMTPEEVTAIAEKVCGGLFLPLMRQLLGIDPESFSDDESVQAIRDFLASYAKGGPTVPLVYADIASAAAAFSKAVAQAGTARQRGAPS